MLKKRFFRLSAIVLALCLIVPQAAIAAPSSGSYDQKITIIHTNDVHGNVEIEPYVKGYVDSLKASGGNVVLVSGGDAFAGTPFASMSNGIDVAKVMSMTGYEAMTVGNHEYMQTAAYLAGVVKESAFPFLAANATDKLKALLPNTKDYIIKQFGTTKIAFIGLTCAASGGYGVGADAAVAAAEKARDSAKAEGATVFIAMAHMGVTEADKTMRSTYIADKCPWLSVIIDAHCHTAHKNGLVQNGVLICETGEYGTNIGEVSLYLKGGAFLSAEAKLIQVKGAEKTCGIKPDAEVQKYIDGVKAKNSAYLSEIVANIPVDLNGEKNFIRSRETNFGDITTDAMIWKTGTDFAIFSGPYIRTSIPKGLLTRETLESAFYADTDLAVISISGKKIYELIESSVGSYPEVSNGFQQLGGLRVLIDPAKKKGSRILSLTDNKGAAVAEGKTYTVAILKSYLKTAVGENAVEGKDYKAGYGSAAAAFLAYVNSGVIITGLTDGRVKTVSEVIKYTDVKNHWAEADIYKMAEMGILRVTSGGAYNPDGAVTRAELIKALTIMFSYPPTKFETSFYDIPGHWAEEYLRRAEGIGLITGTAGGYLWPDELATREDLALLMYKAFDILKVKLPEKTAQIYFSDAKDFTEGVLKAVTALQKAGLITGQPDGKFGPKATLTRAELAASLSRMLSLRFAAK